MDSDNSKFKKILWILVLIPICIIGVIIFGRKIVTPSNEEIIENLHNVKNYSCNVQYKFINSKSEYSENTKQYYSADNGMRIEFQDEDGRVKVYKGSEIQIKDENNKEYTIDKNIDEIYPLAFMCNILDDKMYGQLEVINSEWSDDEYIRVTIDYPSGNKHLDKAEFYVDKKTKCPVLLRIFDDTDKERILISYKDFKENKQLDESLF
ncbi:germination lipoprotein GerS-related protein [uncultured Clostridium sp.]|uniref:germination lipoprotein GerS-related protein n=1 Tax=uncultured Clostridium sp. TaxID=59620 RepID=UPI0025E1B4CF|nr:germination lipoprotein GerS-related protein [uncultured Clostridium sp.]